MKSAGNWVFYLADALPAGIGDPVDILGGKGAGLKEMVRAELPVPPGFTISTAACRRYYELQRQWPDGLEDEIQENLLRLEADTGRTWGRGPDPLLLAVRSGAAASMPGMLETVLNCGLTSAVVRELGDMPSLHQAYEACMAQFSRSGAAAGELTADAWQQLMASVRVVFDSWQCPAAVAYRRHRQWKDPAGTAVTVQAMVPAEVSGVIFTRDPMHPEPERMVIEATFGLCAPLVAGQTTPDRFLVDRRDGRQIETLIGDRRQILWPVASSTAAVSSGPALSPQQLVELSRLGLRVEQHFGHSVDVEWAWAGGQFALLQVRPIRQLHEPLTPESIRQETVRQLSEAAAGERRLWVLHNLAETLPAPTPLTWDVLRQFMSGVGGFGRMYRRLGYRPTHRVRREGFLELIAGRPYADPERLAEMFWGSLPLVYELDDLARDRSLLEGGPTRFAPERAGPGFLLALPSALWSMLRVANSVRRLRSHGDARFEQQVLPRYLDFIAAARDRSLAGLTEEQLLAELGERRRRVLDEFGPESLLPGFAGGLAFAALQSLLVQLAGPEEGTSLAGTLVTALDGDTTFEQNRMLYEVAIGQRSVEVFLQRHGHRGFHEMELAEPRWREAPASLEPLLARLRDGPPPEELRQRNLARQRQAEEDLPRVLARWGGSSLQETVYRHLRCARRLLPYRESGKHYLMIGYALIRDAIEELARRWELGDDVYFLAESELAEFRQSADRLRQEIVDRRGWWQACRHLDFPDVIDSRSLDQLRQPPEIVPSASFRGLGIAPGVATGEALVVHDPAGGGDWPTECILVCSTADPGWTPLFLAARAIVLERGGMLSHAAIVARDLGIPAVVYPQATRVLASGDRLSVDGSQGLVMLLKHR